MMEFLRRGAFALVVTLPLLAGCASDGCDYLVYEETPEAAPPLVLPEGVPAAADSGAFRVPPGNAAISDRCIARPPMTLPPEVLIDPEEADEETSPEAPVDTSGPASSTTGEPVTAG
ncbi:MAG TPA: hypothetical protein VF267_02425 [Gammaproteobacteria bacterium]